MRGTLRSDDVPLALRFVNCTFRFGCIVGMALLDFIMHMLIGMPLVIAIPLHILLLYAIFSSARFCAVPIQSSLWAEMMVGNPNDLIRKMNVSTSKWLLRMGVPNVVARFALTGAPLVYYTWRQWPTLALRAGFIASIAFILIATTVFEISRLLSLQAVQGAAFTA